MSASERASSSSRVTICEDALICPNLFCFEASLLYIIELLSVLYQ